MSMVLQAMNVSVSVHSVTQQLLLAVCRCPCSSAQAKRFPWTQGQTRTLEEERRASRVVLCLA